MSRRQPKPRLSAADVLRLCQSNKTELMVSRSGLKGRVIRLLERHVYVACHELDGQRPQVESIVCIEFNHGCQSGAFFARVTEWDEDTMVLDRPEQVLYVDVRKSFRVPTDNVRGLLADAEGVEGQVLDVSRQGFRIAAEGTSFERGQDTTANVVWNDDLVVAVVRVVAIREHEVCFLIPDPPDDWMRLVGKLEREWMRRNRG
jgi:hypothetical protein